MNEGGYRHPAVCAALVARYLSDLHAPLLDAGVGTGLVGDLLSLLGYQKLTGVDISNNMLDVARRKGIYCELKNADLLGNVGLPFGHYAGVVAAGVFTTGHLGTRGFDTLSSLVAKNGWIITTIKSTSWDGGFSNYLNSKEKSGAIKILEKTEPYNSIPGVSTNAPSLALVAQKL
tara:strand:- start:65 stop:589 length:525 start_codon:yes stop_codon:yes gene_type:complete